MKKRIGFVTNSSSASYIVCFARIDDDDKAKEVLTKHNIKPWTADEIKEEQGVWGLDRDWAGICVDSQVGKVIKEFPNSEYVLLEEMLDALWDDELEEYEYDYDFRINPSVEDIKSENGFADIIIEEGEGYNG